MRPPLKLGRGAADGPLVNATPPPTVSCVVVTFNHERWVREALDSVLAQDLPAGALQLVVVDNGSTDATPGILAEYADVAEIVLLDGGPLNAAVNAGQALAHGTYFTGLSGDDAWTPGRLGPMVDVLEHRPEVGLVYGDMEVVGPESETLHPSWRALHALEVHEGRLLGRLLSRNLVFAPAVLMRGSLRAALLPIPEQAGWEDWWFASTAARISEVAYLPRTVTRYRRHPEALSNPRTPEARADFLREDLRFRGWLLRTLAVGEADPHELLDAVLAQVDGAVTLAELTGRTPQSALRIGERDRRAARSERRRAEGAPDLAEQLAGLVRSVGHDPTDPRTARALSALAGTALETGQAGARDPLRPEDALLDARERVTLLLGDELLADPELLSGHLRGAGTDADTTLAVFAAGADPVAVTACLEAVLAETGSDADVLLVDLPDTPSYRAALAVRATERLTRGGHDAWPWSAIPPVVPVLAAAS